MKKYLSWTRLLKRCQLRQVIWRVRLMANRLGRAHLQPSTRKLLKNRRLSISSKWRKYCGLSTRLLWIWTRLISKCCHRWLVKNFIVSINWLKSTTMKLVSILTQAKLARSNLNPNHRLNNSNIDLKALNLAITIICRISLTCISINNIDHRLQNIISSNNHSRQILLNLRSSNSRITTSVKTISDNNSSNSSRQCQIQ